MARQGELGENSKLNWAPEVGRQKSKAERQKGKQNCSSKSSDSYYVESVIEELKNENLTVSTRARVSFRIRGHQTLNPNAFLFF